MGLTPFACITEQDCVRVVYPDGHIEERSRSCSVHELLRGNPDYFVCGSSPYTITNRMASHEQLEKGFTYFVGAAPNAQPFMESHPKRTHRGASRMLPRFSRHGVPAREMRSPTHQSRRVFDVHSAKLQLEGMKTASGAGLQKSPHHHLILDRPPRHLKLVFFRHCLQALRLPRHYSDLSEPSSLSSDDESMSSSSSAMKDVEIVNSLLKSAARSELGMYVSRRQEFYLRRARRRRKTMWKPVLQSISEMSPVVDFNIPEPQQAPESAMSKRFSPPRPSPPRPTKNISPPRQPARKRSPPKYISPPRQQVGGAPQKYISPPRQIPQRRKPSNQRSLYMA